MKQYIVYDGRANVDPDDACILEVFPSENDDKAKEYFTRHYKNTDSVLCDEDNNIVY